MTDKAPERIWATEDADNHGEDRFHSIRKFAGSTEYVRADLLPQWQPIETAPRDGTRILAYYDADEGVYDVLFDEEDGWVSQDYSITDFHQPDFTHWLPLPEPPK